MRPTSWSVSIQRADGRRPSADSQVPRWIYATTVLTVPRFGRPADEPVWQTPGGVCGWPTPDAASANAVSVSARELNR